MAMGSFEWFHSEWSRLLDGGLAGAEAKNEILSDGILEIHSRAIVGSAKLCWVVDLCREVYLYICCLDGFLRAVNAVQASLIDWLKGGRPRRILYSLSRTCSGIGCGWVLPSEENPSEASIPSYAVVVSALVLLSLVYQYLTGTVDLGSSKAFSRSSLDFRDIYVPVVLFLGAYVWIKFREVALRGVHKRVVKRGRVTKVVYDARLTPPKWNGEAVPKLELGQFSTEQEAHNKFLIAAFYYNRDAGLLDGWFQVPPMSEEGRSLRGPEFGAWVKNRAKKVYEDFKKRKEAALLLQELLENEVTAEQGDVNVNLGEHQERAVVSEVENLGMDMTMPNNQGWECATQSFGGMHVGFVNSVGYSLGFQEESAIPIPQPTPNPQSGMGINNSNQLNLLQVVQNQQQLITSLQQQLQELGAQFSVLQNQERVHQQQLEEFRVHISQLESQHFVQQQLQVINAGVPSLDVEMEQSMPHPNHLCRPRDSAF